MSSITFDETHWPLLIVRFSGVATPEEFEAYLAHRLACMRRQERHVVIYDTRKARLIPSEHRQRHVEWIREYEALRDQTLLGNALIITSPVIRLTMNLVIHLRSDVLPYFVAATLPQAALWGADRLRDAGEVATAEGLRQHFEPQLGSRDK
jgi:hypothetical protein